MKKNNNVPKHIAIIMDGNGRWAKKKLLGKKFGHREGAKTLKKITEYCQSIGVQNLTVYAFSTENWKRSEKEVSDLMSLLEEYIDKFIQENEDTNLKIKVIGDKSRLSTNLQKKIKVIQEISEQHTGINLNLAINYGGRDEILRATKKIANDIKDGIKHIDSINEETFVNYLDNDVEDPEILIRTSGEFRLSNFLLWQLAYTEIFIIDKLWPDFKKEDIDDIIEEFNKRERRFGE